MPRAVELVLEIEPNAASEWCDERAARSNSANHHLDRPSVGSAVANALERSRDMAVTKPREAITIRIVERRGRGERVVLEEWPDTRRVTVSHARPLSPGVTLRRTTRNVQLAPGVPLTQSDAVPPDFKLGDSESDEWRPAPALAAYCTGFQWRGPDGRAVEIILLDALDTEATQRDPAAPRGSARSGHWPAFCELRLSVLCDDGTLDVDKKSDVDASCDGAVKAAVSALFVAAQWLIERVPAFPVLIDVYARATGDASGSEPVRATRVDLAGARTPHEAFVAIAGNVAQQWFGNECGARTSTQTEFVHQMRVALRRAKTLLKTFPRWVDDDWRTRVAPGFKWLGQILGEVRDGDVLVDSTLPMLINADTEPAAWSGIIAAADAGRLEARDRLQQVLRSPRYAALSLAWLSWLAVQNFTAGPPDLAQRSLARYVAKRVRRRFERLTAEPKLTSLDANGRHQRRIEAKRLRYTLEFFELLVAPSRRRNLARRLSRIQSVLGEGSDTVAAQRFLDNEGLAVTPYQRGFAHGWGEAVNRSAAQEGERLLGKLRKPKFTHRL
jgi:CHAD domain-containing protein